MRLVDIARRWFGFTPRDPKLELFLDEARWDEHVRQMALSGRTYETRSVDEMFGVKR